MSSTIVEKAPTSAEAQPIFRRLRRGQVILGVLLLALVAVMILTAFGPPLWQLLGFGTFLLAIVIVVLLALGMLLITLVVAAITRMRTPILPWLWRLGRLFLVLVTLLVAIAGAMVGSQWHTSTPPILGVNGQPLPGSIASLEQVTLNGSQQWITIRGKNVHNPVLLYLHGGPGASELSYVRTFLGALEDHFVVVNWDQPGAGKSYGAVPITALTPQRYVADAHALIQLLRTRFHQDKIYLLAHSWGTDLGIMLVQKYPELFAAYIGSGQDVNLVADEVMAYQFALMYAAQHGDTTTVDTLRRNGPPPYGGELIDVFWKALAYVGVLNTYMDEHAKNQSSPMDIMLTPEYGLIDKVNWVRGEIDGMVVNSQLEQEHLDLTRHATRLAVPVYFFVGRWDVSEMPSLVEQYYNVLQAPHKELIWFDKSGHSPIQYEPNKVVDVLVNHVLEQTWPRH